MHLRGNQESSFLAASSLQVCWTLFHALAAPRGLRSAGFSFGEPCLKPMSRRVCFLIDGFNLYHSLAQACAETGDPSLKWLDLVGLSKDCLHLVDKAAELQSIHYFTAIPEHLHKTDPERLHRHKTYLRAITAHGRFRPEVHFGRIQQQSVRVNTDTGQREGRLWREKGTDVALAMTMVEMLASGAADDAIIISGDADYLPAARSAMRMFPQASIRFGFPRGRTSTELLKATPLSFTFTTASYARHQLPESVQLPSGKWIHRPTQWHKSNRDPT
jgi:uncharacterized LabA/DUF88 family protein